MNLDQLERLARAAGYATVPDQDTDDTAPLDRVPRAVRFKTPDAPAPRPSAALALAGPSARAAVTTYVGSALRSAQGLLSTGRAHA